MAVDSKGDSNGVRAEEEGRCRGIPVLMGARGYGYAGEDPREERLLGVARGVKT